MKLATTMSWWPWTITHQGWNIQRQLFGVMCQWLGMKKTRTTSLHPQSDRLLEHFNRTLATELVILTSQHQKDLDQHLPFVLWAYRIADQESSQCTPAALVFGRELWTQVDLVFGLSPEPKITGGLELGYLRRLRGLDEVHQLPWKTLQETGARQKRA